MLEVQIRYIQVVLTTAIFVGLLMDNIQLLTAVFVGLLLVWQLEMLSGQLRVDSKEYRLILIFISITFLPVLFNILSESNIQTLLYIVLLLVPLIGIFVIGFKYFQIRKSFIFNDNFNDCNSFYSYSIFSRQHYVLNLSFLTVVLY
jgi:hypothetical protein